MRKTFTAFFSIFAIIISGFLGYFTQYFTPQIKPLIAKEIVRKTTPFIDLKITPENIKFKWLPLSASLNNIRIKPKNKIKQYLAPVDIKNIIIKLNYLDLLKGNISIKSIDVIDSNLKIIIKKFTPSNEQKITNLDFLEKIPVDTLNLVNVNFYLKLIPLKTSINAKDISAKIENLKNALITNIQSKNIFIKKTNNSNKIKVTLDSKILIEKNRIVISQLNLNDNKSSKVKLSGSLSGKWLENKINDIDINSEGEINTKEIFGIINDYVDNNLLSEISGEVKYKIKNSSQSFKRSNPIFSLSSKNLKIKQFVLGDIQLDGKIKNKKLSINEIKVKSNIAQINKGNLKIDLNSLDNLESEIELSNFNLDNLLTSLAKEKGPRGVISQLIANGKITCGGSIKPNLIINCNAKAKDSSFLLHNAEKKNFIEISNISAESTVKITNKDVFYDGNVFVNDSKIQASGSVNYESGFYVDLEGQIVDIKNDIKNIANLELEGNLQSKGRVEGNSKTATYTSKINCTECRIKKWNIGNFSSDFSLVKGSLLFENINGEIGQSSHTSDVKVNLAESYITTNLNFSKLQLEDLKLGIQDNVPLPFKIEGDGKAKFKLWGPLELNQLSFDLESNFGYGFVSMESFDNATINLTCRDGHIKTKNVQFNKADTSMLFYGDMNNQGKLNIKSRIKSLLIKNSEFLNALKVNLEGVLNLNATLSGTFSAPYLTIDGYLLDDSVGLTKKQDSLIKIIVKSDRAYGKISLNKNQFIGEIEYPFNEKDAQIALDAKNWNFSHILEGHFPHFKKLNIFSNVNGSMQLTIPNKKISESYGKIQINNFHILRGSYSLYLVKKLNMDIQRGSINDFESSLKGQRTDLVISSKNSKINDLNLQLNGNLDLGVGLIFSSLVEEFKGTTSVSLKIKGPITSPNSNGSVYVQNSILKIKDLNQPITNLNSEITLNNRDLIINQLNGKLGDGNIYLNGKVNISKKEPQLSLNGLIKEVNFKSIEGVNIYLNGDYKLKGKKPPYKLSANLEVYDGEIDKAVTLDSETKSKKLSKYAPVEFQEIKSNSLDLNVNFSVPRPLPTKIITTQLSVETSLTGKLNVSSKISDPILNGSIKFDQNGKIKLRNNEYNLVNSSINYKNQKMDNPFVNLEVGGRVQEYDININIRGTGQDPKLTFQSTPQLTNSEIINLILLGYTSNDIDNETGPTDQKNQLAFEASSIILKEKLGLTRGVNDKLGLEVDISSTFNEDQSKPIPVITIKKQLGKKLNASASRTIEKSATNAVKMDYQLNRNLSIIGSYIKEEGKETTNDTTEDGDALGLDFEYKIEFK